MKWSRQWDCSSVALALCLAVAGSSLASAASSSGHRALLQAPATSLQPAPTTKSYTWHVTVGKGAPDCWVKDVILINGQFQPTIEVTQGDFLEVNVFNDLPADYPSVSTGISIHWHGLGMRSAQWYDGAGYVTQCPTAPGSNFTYYFQVNEPAGTYFWHDHSSAFRADGLLGALIVRPRYPAQDEVWDYDQEKVMFLTDWYHGSGTAISMMFNRPFDLNQATLATGAWRWAGLPQGMLVNGKGNYLDCQLLSLNSIAGQAPNETTCNVTDFSIAPGKSRQQPWASPSNPGCSHETVDVTPGSITRLRLINAGSLLYMTVCFEGHNVTIIAADAVPTEPMAVGPCLDINSGQRYDILLEADQPTDNYWITVQPQYRIGSPNGFAVLRYANATANALPARKNAQPGQIKPWTIEQTLAVKTAKALLNPASFVAAASVASEVAAASASPSALLADKYLLPAGQTSLQVPAKTRTILLNGTQPILKANGQLRWALNNVAGALAPGCKPAMLEAWSDRSWLAKKAAAPSPGGSLLGAGNGAQEGTGAEVTVYNTADMPMLSNPTPGLHVVPIAYGEVIELVLQNNAAGRFNGDYQGCQPDCYNRTGQEQHSFHLHGHHFWVVGSASGTWNTSVEAGYNTVDAAFRDTYTLPPMGWATIRFKADNPGMWLYHCHQLWHLMMGQRLVFAEALDRLPAPPQTLPACPATCTYSFAPYRPDYVQAKYGNTGAELPEDPAGRSYGSANGGVGIKLPPGGK